jgi:hypothetical protein
MVVVGDQGVSMEYAVPQPQPVSGDATQGIPRRTSSRTDARRCALMSRE